MRHSHNLPIFPSVYPPFKHRYATQGWGKCIDTLLEYKFKYIEHDQVQVQVEVQCFPDVQVHYKCIWNVFGYNHKYQVHWRNYRIKHSENKLN